MDTAPSKKDLQTTAISPVMQTVSTYITKALKKPLPAPIVEITKHHLMDSLAAIISGASLPPGKAGIAYVKTQGGTPEACVPASRIVTTAANAAFGSGMCAHADETDDSNGGAAVHIGCGVVPGVLAMAERVRASGTELLRATALGYDIAARLSKSLGALKFFNSGHNTHMFGTLFGASAGAGALCGLNVTQIRHLLSYTAQSAGGISYMQRDIHHFEKSYAHGAKSARDAVAAATMVEMGFTGVDDCFSGDKNFYFAFNEFAQPDLLVHRLGEEYEIANTNIKRWSSGSPTQAVLDSLSLLIKTHNVKAPDVVKASVRTSHQGHIVTNNRLMPNICMQHLVAIMLMDGTITFNSAHDYKRMKDKKVLDVRSRVSYLGDDELEQMLPQKHGIVELTLRDGRTVRHHTQHVRGTTKNPMERADVDEKAFGLIAPVLGKKKTRALIDSIWDLDGVKDVRKLRPYLMT